MQVQYSYLRSIRTVVLTVAVTGCIEPYTASVPDEDVHALVVQGLLNSTGKEVTVKLSRAISLNDDQSYPPEEGAKVFVEDEVKNSSQLGYKDNGIYNLSDLNVDIARKYRLHILTKNGKEYYSDYVQPKPAPSLDSVVWRPSPEGVTLAVNSHDATGNSRYYQWSFTETWSYTSVFYSYFKLVNGKVIPRTAAENVYFCWTTKESTKINVVSTTQLAEDRVSEFPVSFISKGDQRLDHVYSILVRQRTLDEKTYNYLKQLEKTTEKIGGLFDPLPWQAEGNIHNVSDSNEPVLGYFNASSVQEKRLTFSFYDLPFYLLTPLDFHNCKDELILFEDLYKYNDDTPLIRLEGNPPIGYSTAPIGCVDCRVRGGINVKPDFMP